MGVLGLVDFMAGWRVITIPWVHKMLIANMKIKHIAL